MAVAQVNGPLMGQTGSIDDKNVRRFTQIWRVLMDSVYDDPVTARDAAGVPAMFSAYQGPLGQNQDTGAIVVAKSVKQDENPYIYTVEVSYASVTVLTTMSLKWQQDRRIATRDFNGRAVRNSAGSYFDPPIEREFSRAIIQISRAESALDFVNRCKYADAVNSDAWFGFDPGTVKIAAPPADSFYESGQFGWHVVWELHFREEGWLHRELDAGYRQIGPDGKEREIFDEFGHLASSPTLLNGRGGLLRDTYVFLDADATAVDPSWTVDSNPVNVFPDPPYYVLLDDEVAKVTAHGPGNTLQVTRGQQGTTAAAHVASDTAKISMEPYFLEFSLYKTTPFGPLNLP